MKRGDRPCVVATPEGLIEVPLPNAVVPVDTTAAGDSFNAGYLAARLQGVSAREAALLGHRLAGQVVQHRGAIIPREAMRTVVGSPPV